MKRLFTRRTAGTDAKVDRLVMEYTRRSAASPLLQHTERLVLDRSEGIAHLSSVGKHTAERRCSLPSAAARLLDTLPQGLLTVPPLASGTDDAAARYALTLRWSDGASQRITGRYDCTGLPDGWAELAAEADILYGGRAVRPVARSRRAGAAVLLRRGIRAARHALFLPLRGPDVGGR